MTPVICFGLYKPLEGKDGELLELMKDHFPTLERLELVTAREPIVVRSKNGTIIEVFEWSDTGSAALAHQHPDVAAIWEAMGKIAEFPGLDSLEEKTGRFPHFEPVAV